jgi:hypothetical protein
MFTFGPLTNCLRTSGRGSANGGNGPEAEAAVGKHHSVSEIH